MVSSMQRKEAGRFWKEEKLELSDIKNITKCYVILAKTEWFEKADKKQQWMESPQTGTNIHMFLIYA